jgi:Fic family protein
MDKPLQRLDALCRHPSLKVSPSQKATIVGDVVHSVMYPYFLKKSPEEQERLKAPVLAHLRAIADYCLHEYVENPEPRLTIEFIKGLHRVLYHNTPSIPIKAVDGSMTAMVPGAFKTTPVFMRRHSNPDEWFGTSDPESVASEMEILLEQLHDAQAPLFQRYCRFMLDLTTIHPFPDSNGKLARILGEAFLLKQGIFPPCFALYESENKLEVAEMAERYTIDPQRDISTFYPVVIKRYLACLVLANEDTK